MKRAFISHPFRDNPVANRRKIADICRKIAETQPDVMPVSPVHAFSYLDDAIHRQLAIGYCLELLELCDEVWMYGDWQKSEGCVKEFVHAWRLNKPICEEHDIQNRRKQVAIDFVGCFQKSFKELTGHEPVWVDDLPSSDELTAEDYDAYAKRR